MLFAVGVASFALFESALLARTVRGARVGTEVTLLGFMPGSTDGVPGIRVGLTVASCVARIAVVAGAVVAATVVTTADGWDVSSALNAAILADSILRAWSDRALRMSTVPSAVAVASICSGPGCDHDLVLSVA